MRAVVEQGRLLPASPKPDAIIKPFGFNAKRLKGAINPSGGMS